MKSKYVLPKITQQIATRAPGSGGRPLRKAALEQGSQLILTGTEKRLPRLGQQWVTRELMSG